MSFVLKPWQLLLVALAGWVNLQQQQLFEFQDDQIRMHALVRQKTRPSFKALGNGDLSLARSRDLGRGDASERPIPAGQSPVR